MHLHKIELTFAQKGLVRLLPWKPILKTLYLILNHVAVCNKYHRKIHCLTSEFHTKSHAKNRYRMNREAMSAISVFQVKFDVEFTRQAVNFSWIAQLKINPITGRKQTFCIFVSRTDQCASDGYPLKVSCQNLANRKEHILGKKTTFYFILSKGNLQAFRY